MTFKELIDLTKYRINETDAITEVDDQIDAIVKNAINYAYMVIATRVDKHTKSTSFAVSPTIKLPSDFYSLANISSDGYRLNKLDYEIEGDLLIVKASDLTSIDMDFVYFPPKLVNPTDDLVIKDAFSLAIPIYAHYSYMAFKKKMEIASMLFQEFNLLINGKFAKVEGDNSELQRNS